MEFAFWLVTLPAVTCAGFAWMYIRRLRRPILLSPQSVFKPPLRWRWSLSHAAIFHRRMVLALRTAQATADNVFASPANLSESPMRRAIGSARKKDPGWESILGELEAVAIGIDRRLLGLEKEPREVRRRMAVGIEHDVAEVERAAGAAVDMFQSWQRSLPQGSAANVVDRLSALKDALEEIKSIQGPVDEPSSESGGSAGRSA